MNSPRVFRSLGEWRTYRESLGGRSVGFVPTMGALHHGHAALLKRARAENEIVILSIYVNQTQFNDPKDYEKYPQTLEADLEIARRENVDAVFAPVAREMYPDEFRYRVTENDFSQTLCGEFRPGHFDGVLTVVLKLFSIVQPMRAYFGEKDFQQVQLIEGMVRSFFLPITIVRVPTVREKSGLALSSRNARLSPEARESAAQIHHALRLAKSSDEVRSQLTNLGFEVEYARDVGSRRLVAAWIDGVRLIDNVEVGP